MDEKPARDARRHDQRPVTPPVANEKDRKMDTLVNTLDAIARLATTATRAQLATLREQTKTLDAAARIALEIGDIDDMTVVAIGEAHRAATSTLDVRISAIGARQQALIDAVPQDRRSRTVLMAMVDHGNLLNVLEAGAREVDFITRELGDFVDVLADGVLIGVANAHSIRVSPLGDLVAEGIGRWPLDDIEAASCEDGLAILLQGGRLIEFQQRN